MIVLQVVVRRDVVVKLSFKKGNKIAIPTTSTDLLAEDCGLYNKFKCLRDVSALYE